MQTNKSLLCILVWFDAAARPRLKMHVCVAVLDLVPVKHAAEKHQGGPYKHHTDTFSCHRIKQKKGKCERGFTFQAGNHQASPSEARTFFFLKRPAATFLTPPPLFFFIFCPLCVLCVSPVGPTSVPLLAVVIFTAALFGARSLTE